MVSLARRSLPLAALLALLATSPLPPAAAQDPPPPTAGATAETRPADDPDLVREKAVRRARAAERIGPDAALLVLSPEGSWFSPGASRNPDFEYLSPRAAREAAVLVAPARPAAQDAEPSAANGPLDRLYLPARNPALERWTGPEPGPDDATAKSAGFGDARVLDRLAEDLSEVLRERSTLFVSGGPRGDEPLAKVVAGLRERLPGRWVRIAGAPGGGRDDLAESLRRALPERWTAGPDVDAALKDLRPLDVRPAGPPLGALREDKSPAEIARIRRAVESTVAGMRDALRAAAPGVAEYQLAAIVELRCRLAGASRQAFPSIVGSGPNSCVLHYDRNRRTLEAGDLVVLDVGGEFEGYAADVTRTFPASGRFTDEQAKAYDAVLDAQKAALAAVKPGVTLRQVHEAAHAVLRERGLANFFLHGTCHSVGLEVHDPWRMKEPLRAGCVITVEPGVYDASRNLGIRIEDTVVVTEDGCEILSAGMPKERAAIEALLAEDPPPGLLGR